MFERKVTYIKKSRDFKKNILKSVLIIFLLFPMIIHFPQIDCDLYKLICVERISQVIISIT